MSQFQNVPFCPISASGSNFNPRNTTCIPVVKLFAFLDIEQISGDFGLKRFETGSHVFNFLLNCCNRLHLGEMTFLVKIKSEQKH